MTVIEEPARPHQPPATEPGECLFCYLERSVGSYGCRGHQGSEAWRDAQPTPMPGLMSWLQRHGGFCDCEVLMNVWDRGNRDAAYEPLFCSAAEERLSSGDW